MLFYLVVHIGCEIITEYFILEVIISLLKDKELYEKYSDTYTFHFIPLLNPEGYIISTSNVLKNTLNLNQKELEKLATEYLLAYDQDDYLSMQGKCLDKKYKKVLKSSLLNIENGLLRKSVKNILKKCNLNEDVLPIWSANGKGIDINSNSIHRFKEIKALRKSQKFGPLRYNDIKTTIPSPMSFPGVATFEKRVPENLGLYKYIKEIYNLKDDTDESLLAIFSYHSTGGEIYGFCDKEFADKSNIQIQSLGMNEYSKYTNYSLVNESLKYGVMDYYRVALSNVCSLTIELSKKNANPIGFLSNIESFLNEIRDNKKALLNTIDKLNSIY